MYWLNLGMEFRQLIMLEMQLHAYIGGYIPFLNWSTQHFGVHICHVSMYVHNIGYKY